MKKTVISLFLLAPLFTMAQSDSIRANGITIAYESFGRLEDDVIILIAGVGQPLTGWPADLCLRLADNGFRVIRFDSRDTGLSTHLDSLGSPDWSKLAAFLKTCDPAPLPYTINDMAQDVIGLMDGLNIDKAHIVGASMGGAIAQLMAINFPTRVLTLTTIASSSGDPDLPEPDSRARLAMSTPPPGTTDKETLVRYLVNVYRALGSIDDDHTLRERALSNVNRSWDPNATERQIAAIAIGDNCDRRKDLKKITAPTYVIHGDVDPLVSPEAAQQIASSIKGAQLFIINGMGHDLSKRFIVHISDLILSNATKIRDDQASR